MPPLHLVPSVELAISGTLPWELGVRASRLRGDPFQLPRLVGKPCPRQPERVRVVEYVHAIGVGYVNDSTYRRGRQLSQNSIKALQPLAGSHFSDYHTGLPHRKPAQAMLSSYRHGEMVSGESDHSVYDWTTARRLISKNDAEAVDIADALYGHSRIRMPYRLAVIEY